jgi:LysR family transcriptional regulator, glycine cleavage system transcriptional activator
MIAFTLYTELLFAMIESPGFRRKLPSLMAVRAFEAAARLGSFTAAARELLLTQSAISRHVRNLETTVGVKLFQRHGPHISVTAEGRSYMAIAGDAFDQISAATAALRRPRDHPVFTVSMPPSLAIKWFTPRFSDFLRTCPKVELQVRTSCRIVDLESEGVDAAIRYGRGDWPDVEAEELAREQVFPVCSPGYLKSCGSPVDLRKVTFLHGDLQEDWRMWLRAAEQPQINSSRGPRFDDATSLLQVAISGLGLALGSTLIVEKDLKEGSLVAPFTTALNAEFGYWLVVAKGQSTHPIYGDFRRWLRNQIGRRAHMPLTPKAA